MTTARVLITKDCHRSCAYCCNAHDSTKEALETLTDRTELLKHDTLVLTGGEPLLYPGYTCEVAEWLRSHGKTVYLNTTIWPSWMSDRILKAFHGITYSVHHPFTMDDRRMLEIFQRESMGLGKIHRLNIDPDIQGSLMILPEVLSRVSILTIMEDGECPPPEDKLYLMAESLETARCTRCKHEMDEEDVLDGTGICWDCTVEDCL